MTIGNGFECDIFYDKATSSLVSRKILILMFEVFLIFRWIFECTRTPGPCRLTRFTLNFHILSSTNNFLTWFVGEAALSSCVYGELFGIFLSRECIFGVILSARGSAVKAIIVADFKNSLLSAYSLNCYQFFCWWAHLELPSAQKISRPLEFLWCFYEF